MAARSFVLRTPKDDAPPYDPSLWEGGRDCYFLTRRCELQLLERRLQQSNDVVDQHAPSKEDPAAAAKAALGASSSRGSVFSWQYLWDTCQRVILRRTPKSQSSGASPTNAEMAALSFDDLFLRFQSALQRGDVVASACYAKELARRKAQVSKVPTVPPLGSVDADGNPKNAPLAPSVRHLRDHIGVGSAVTHNNAFGRF